MLHSREPCWKDWITVVPLLVSTEKHLEFKTLLIFERIKKKKIYVSTFYMKITLERFVLIPSFPLQYL